MRLPTIECVEGHPLSGTALGFVRRLGVSLFASQRHYLVLTSKASCNALESHCAGALALPGGLRCVPS